MLSWLGYLLAGKLVIYLLMKFPLPSRIEKIKFFKSLHECDLCLGVWVFFFFAVLFRMDLLNLFGFPYYPVLNEGVTGGIISYIVHIFFIGLRTKYEVITL